MAAELDALFAHLNAFARLRPADADAALRMALRMVLLAAAPMTAVAAVVARTVFPPVGAGRPATRGGEEPGAHVPARLHGGGGRSGVLRRSPVARA